jgi:L-alanine-DL-glutamate epimerase-like enolase superfamily enzyme
MATIPPLTEGQYTNGVTFELDCTEHPFRESVVANLPSVDAEGYMAVPAGPGLGVCVVPEAVSEFRVSLETIS